MSGTDSSCSTKDDPIDTWSSCNISLDYKKSIAYELPPLDSKCYKRSQIEQECLQKVWNAQQLPVNLESVSKPSVKLEKYILLKKNEHEIALQNFKAELEDLHKLCDSKIDELERNVQVGIDKIHDDVENKKRNFCDMACVDDEKYECLESTVESMLGNEKAKIDDLSEQTRIIEKERQCNAVKIFKKFFQIVRKLCYVPVDEHKTFFEKEIAVYNQTILENNKNYEKTKLKFRLSIDVLKQNFYIWMKDIKDDRNAVCRRNALDDFYSEYDKFNNAGLRYSQKLEGQTALCRLKSRTTIVSYVVSQWDLSIPFPATRFSEQSAQFDTTMSSTDATITGFIRSYKFYMSKYLGRLIGKIKKLRSIVEMMDTEAETGDEELITVEDIYEKSKKQVDDFTAELETIWSNSLQALKDKAREVFKIFIDFGSPWDVLSVTFLKQQDTATQQFKNRAIKSEATHLDLQQKILVEVPKLREEENVPKLEKKWAQVLAILSKKRQKYQSDFDEDCKMIKRTTEFMVKEVNAMANKLDKFLQTNKSILDEPSNDNESTVTSFESGQSDNCFKDFKLEEIIMHDMELIGNQLDVLDDWKSKVIKSMLSYRPAFEKEIIEVVELWQDNLINQEFQNLEKNLKSIEDLQMDIRRDVYDVRYNELQRHRKDLENHIKIINRLLNESTKCADKLLFYSDVIDDYKLEVSQLIDDRSCNIQHSSQIKYLQDMLKIVKSNYTDKVDVRMNVSIERIKKKMSLVSAQNDSFFSEITLFNNGGSYSSEELNLAKKEMTTLMKNIEKDESTNRLTISKITDQALKEIHNFDKSSNEILIITLEKLRMQEDVMTAIMICENSVALRIKQTIKMNQAMTDSITQFIEKCQSKVELNEVISTLNETISKVLKTLDLMKGPFPEIDIPKELQSIFYNANNVSKNANSKKRTMSVKSLTNEPVNIAQDHHNACNAGHFPSAISKFILDALAAIENKAMNYYTVLVYKKDELPFADQNDSCENCINNSLQKLNIIYIDTYNFWIEGANRLSKFFESIEMPSIEWYLRDERISDEEKSTVSLSTMGSDPNQYVSKKLNENVIGLQSTLQEMLCMLQSKNTNGPLTSDESGNVQ